MDDADAAPLLEVGQVTKQFPGVKALQDVDLTLNRGEVLAVIGENGAGKSTLMKILAGVQPLDAGEIWIDGKIVQLVSVEAALSQGIALIHQELNLADNLDVGANIFLGREPLRLGLIDHGRIHRESKQFLNSVGLQVDPATIVRELTVGKQQMVEIAKALSINARVLIMDEPTSAIGEHEAQTLFKAIRRLTDRGAGIIYVSHRLSELAQIADEYSIFRDGAFVESGRMADIDRAHLVRGIVGQELQRIDHKVGRECAATTCLDVSGLSRDGEFHDISP